MQQRSKTLVGAAVVLGVTLVVYLIATAPREPDRQQIADGIETARASIEHHNASSLLSVVSGDYKDATFANVDQLHYFLVRVFRDSGHISIATSATAIDVSGDTAKSVSHVTIKSADSGVAIYDGNVSLNWRREEAHRYLVFPSTVWRVTSADYPALPGMGGD